MKFFREDKSFDLQTGPAWCKMNMASKAATRLAAQSGRKLKDAAGYTCRLVEKAGLRPVLGAILVHEVYSR